jgi:3',5'-nucleoside bisphosphate phosphatase
VRLAAEAGVATLALTDHDTMDGVPEAMDAAREVRVRLVPAVELSVQVPGGSMHLLAYFAELGPEPLTGRLAGLAAGRLRRARRIAERLAALGAPVAWEDVMARATGPVVGRPHLAEALVAAGHARDRQDAFDRYLADGGPAHVPSEGPDPLTAIRWVLESGGAPVLAHPHTLAMSPRALGAFVARLAADGLRGIEVHRPEHLPAQREAYASLARRHGLIACGGSDFHRPDGPVRIGDTGDPPLPAEAAERLLARRPRHEAESAIRYR